MMQGSFGFRLLLGAAFVVPNGAAPFGAGSIAFAQAVVQSHQAPVRANVAAPVKAGQSVKPGLAVRAAAPASAEPPSAPPAPAKARDLGAGIPEASVPSGSYYVGKAFGTRDFKALTNASTPGFLVMRGQVTQGLYRSVVDWARQHGYMFEGACKDCDAPSASKPIGGVSWRDAALWANALSEMRGLDPVYRDKAGKPVRAAVPPAEIDRAVFEPTLSGFRLPTIPEWQIALRGADKGLVTGTYGAMPPGNPNALGLKDTAGSLAEWTGSSSDLGDGTPYRYFCNDPSGGPQAMTACDMHVAGWSGPSVGFRLVRKPGGTRSRGDAPMNGGKQPH